ncbi:hypothetical protein FKP32DRAFT_1548358, partial [Trametes sanguinea]
PTYQLYARAGYTTFLYDSSLTHPPLYIGARIHVQSATLQHCLTPQTVHVERIILWQKDWAVLEVCRLSNPAIQFGITVRYPTFGGWQGRWICILRRMHKLFGTLSPNDNHCEVPPDWKLPFQPDLR